MNVPRLELSLSLFFVEDEEVLKGCSLTMPVSYQNPG